MNKATTGARLATRDEAFANTAKVSLNRTNANGGGVPIFSTNDMMLCDSSESHCLLVSKTGGGKTTIFTWESIYSMVQNGEIVIVTDPKGEMYPKTVNIAKENDYEVIVLNFANPSESNMWNPLHEIKKAYDGGDVDYACELASEFAKTMCVDKAERDPFWGESASDFLFGKIILCAKETNIEHTNLKSVANISNVGFTTIPGSGVGGNILKQYLEVIDSSSVIYEKLTGTVNAPNDTRGGIFSVEKQRTNVFNMNQSLMRMLSKSDFNIADIAKKKTIVYLIAPDEKKTIWPLISSFVTQLYQILIREARNYPNSKLPIKVNFLLDEFANLGNCISEMPSMITAARSRNIRIILMLQDYLQLYAMFGKSYGDTIANNCNLQIYLGIKGQEMKEKLSQACGYVYRDLSKEKVEKKPLIEPHEFNMLKRNEAIVFRDEVPFPFISQFCPYYEMNIKDYGVPHPLPTIPVFDVPVFRIDEYVKALQAAKMQEHFNRMQQKTDKPDAIMDKMPHPFRPHHMMLEDDEPDLDIKLMLESIDTKMAQLDAEEKAKQAVKENKSGEPDIIELFLRVYSSNVKNRFRFPISHDDRKKAVALLKDMLEDSTFNHYLNFAIGFSKYMSRIEITYFVEKVRVLFGESQMLKIIDAVESQETEEKE